MEWAWFCFGMTLSHILAPFLLFTFNLGVEQGAMAASLQGLDKWIVWSAWHSHLKLWMYWLGSVYSRRHSRKMLLLFRVFYTSWANGSQQPKQNKQRLQVSFTYYKKLARQPCANLIIMMSHQDLSSIIVKKNGMKNDDKNGSYHRSKKQWISAAMGRPRSVFLNVELPAYRDARRKVLSRLYNKNRN